MAFVKLQGEQERREHIYYQVDSSAQPIGVGGMGQVFKGVRVDETTGTTRPVAIKFMFSDLPPQAIERARRESSIRLRNDNLIEMLGFIETQEQQSSGDVISHFHVVSELLDGVSLSDILEGKTTGRDGQEVPFAVKMLQDYRSDSEHFARFIVMNILSGLMALHDAGYIHRDIDPSNIMVTADGHIKLIDFGIAKQMNTLTTSDKQLTVAGKFMGKPEYAAPELALGDVQHQNQTTDIYAVGILLYQLIVGHTPFEGARYEILEKQLKSNLPLAVIKNKALRKIVQKACEKKQELRYQSSAQMRVALETMQEDSGASTLTLPGRKTMMGIAIALGLLVVGGAIAFFVGSDNAEQQAQAQRLAYERDSLNRLVDDQMALAKQLFESAQSVEGSSDSEQRLMKAFLAYQQAEQIASSADSAYQVAIPDVAVGMKNIVNALNQALEALREQASGLQALGEAERASACQERMAAIEQFLNQYAPKTPEEDGETVEASDSIDALSDSNSLFQEGKTLQQKRTIAKQQAAIKKFQAAKLMFATEQEKAHCDKEIAACNETIAELRKAQSESKQATNSKAEEPDAKGADQPAPPVQEATLSLSASEMTFKAKPKEAKSVIVTCSTDDWTASSNTSWIHISKMGNQVFVAVDKNDTGDNRTGTVVVRAGAKSATLTVTQSKKKGLGSLLGI